MRTILATAVKEVLRVAPALVVTGGELFYWSCNPTHRTVSRAGTAHLATLHFIIKNPIFRLTEIKRPSLSLFRQKCNCCAGISHSDKETVIISSILIPDFLPPLADGKHGRGSHHHHHHSSAHTRDTSRRYLSGDTAL